MANSDAEQGIFSTSICLEEACEDNPFVAKQRYIKGYPVDQLWQHASFAEALLLMFIGDIPSHTSAALFERLLVGLMNSGPRDPGVRAAMTAGVSKTAEEHLLPIGLLAGSGENNGANEVQRACKFIIKYSKMDPIVCATQRMEQLRDEHAHVAPGFGGHYGMPDPILSRLADDCFALLPDSRIFMWCRQFNAELHACNQGWLASGLVAAVCCELGIRATEAVAIYQLCKAPGIAAQGFEQLRYPINSNPLLADDNYELV